MYLTSTTKNRGECSIAKFGRNWAYSRARGSLTIGVGYPSSHANCTYSSMGISLLPRFKNEWGLVALVVATTRKTMPRPFVSRDNWGKAFACAKEGAFDLIF